MLAIDSSTVNKATVAARLSLASFPWWVVLMVVLLLATVGLYLFYSRLPFLSPEIQKDLDPPQLTTLFSQFGEQIEEIGNPRKIKRLSNKIRFQFYYISLKGWTSPAVFSALMSILMEIETKPVPQAKSREGSSSDVPSEEKFWGRFRTIAVANNLFNDTDLMHLIYILNRDML